MEANSKIFKNNIVDNTVKFNKLFSFRPLIKFWVKESQSNEAIAAAFENIKKQLAEFPELLNPITDYSILEKHSKLIEELLSVSISPSLQKHDSYAAVFLHCHESFYQTPNFKQLRIFETNVESECFNENCCLTPVGRLIASYAKVLFAFYGINISYEYPIIYTYFDEKTGLEKYYRIRIYSWFCEMRPLEELKQLTDDEKRMIIENVDNPEILTKIIPPEKFEFEGFLIYNAVEISDQETISSLKFELIGKESLTSAKKFNNLQHKLRVLLKKRDLKLGLIAFPSEKKDLKNAIKMGNSIILQDSFASKNISTECKIYSDVIINRETKLIYDIKDYVCSKEIEAKLLKAGVRNLLVAPLIYKDELIGLLEVASAIPGELNKVNTLNLNDVYPLFAVCIESSLDDLSKSIQSVIKEKCTAIHPTVDWRFRNAAMNYLNKLRNDIVDEMEEIIFENVNLFYGCSDIKDSSVTRNNAVQSDLIKNLEMAKEIIIKASAEAALPSLEEMSFRINNQIEQLRKGLEANNEITAINFIRNELESTLDYVNELNPEFRKTVDTYKARLDPRLGIFSEMRKEFDDSLQLINETISTELDIQQTKAQKIFPNYFEKNKTDGVEYNMYLGQSLVAHKKYNPMHLQSLRLWQLVTMCIIAKRCIELKDSLTVPLEMTHLIFVQNAPISIKFMYDEKKFDVAGSFDVRSEIIKKRIDKALLKGSNERLVSPGKIAIVYSYEAEAEEYKQYIDFLRTKKYITGKIESFELEDMQGIHGLKALRVSVNSDFVIEKKQNEKVISEIKQDN